MDAPELLVLTAANAAQARGYVAQLEARERDGRLPEGLQWRVVADPDGRRVGSGAATLLVLETLVQMLAARRPRARTSTALWRGARAIVLHSGGDSRRLLGAAAMGKVFMPLPIPDASGRPLALFDLNLAALRAQPRPDDGQVVIGSGDVWLHFDGAVDTSAPGVTGVAMALPEREARRHGVYVPGRGSRVVDFMQKPTAKELRARGGRRPRGQAYIDIGVVYLDASVIRGWLGAVGVRGVRADRRTARGLLASIASGDCPLLDLYGHMLPALAVRTRRGPWLETVGVAGTPAAAAFGAFFDAIRGTPYHVRIVPGAFQHLGTNRELLERLEQRSVRAALGAQRRVAAHGPQPIGTPGFSVGSTVRRGGSAAGPFLIEGCTLQAPLRLGGNNLVTGLPKAAGPVRLGKGACRCGLPVGPRDWVVIDFNIDDDFKTTEADGGTLAGRPLTAWARRLGTDAWRRLHPDGLEPGQATAWDLRLWRIGTAPSVERDQAWMSFRTGCPPERWWSRSRASLAELVPRIEPDRVITPRAALVRAALLPILPDRLRTDALTVHEALALLPDAATAWTLARAVAREADSTDAPLVAARLDVAAARIAARAGRRGRGLVREREERALVRIASVVASAPAVAAPELCSRRPLAVGDGIRAEAPLRLDLAGGWTDTPPICMERGGAVVNVALDVGPVRPAVTVRRLAAPEIRVQSADYRRGTVILDRASAERAGAPGRWSALVLAALRLTGWLPERGSVTQHLERLGGGIEVTTASGVPAGSGLGTSSILGAAALAALAHTAGGAMRPADLVAGTSALEQLMGSGGGWQDQIGGIYGGFKLARSLAGVEQHPNIVRLRVPTAFRAQLEAQLVVLFTGRARRAHDILSNVVRRYLAREPSVMAAVADLHDNAAQMARALRAGDLDGCVEELERYWRLKRTMDPAASSPVFDAIAARLGRGVRAWTLAGAGGGGFFVAIMDDAAAAQRARRTLERKPPHRAARIFETRLAAKGVRIERA